MPSPNGCAARSVAALTKRCNVAADTGRNLNQESRKNPESGKTRPKFAIRVGRRILGCALHDGTHTERQRHD